MIIPRSHSRVLLQLLAVFSALFLLVACNGSSASRSGGIQGTNTGETRTVTVEATTESGSPFEGEVVLVETNESTAITNGTAVLKIPDSLADVSVTLRFQNVNTRADLALDTTLEPFRSVTLKVTVNQQSNSAELTSVEDPQLIDEPAPQPQQSPASQDSSDTGSQDSGSSSDQGSGQSGSGSQGGGSSPTPQPTVTPTPDPTGDPTATPTPEPTPSAAPADLSFSPVELSFETTVGQEQQLALQLSNGSPDTNLSFSSVTITGADAQRFALIGGVVSIAPLQNVNLTISFNSQQSGSFSAALNLASNDPDSPAVVPLSAQAQEEEGGGTGEPDLTVTPASINFGDVPMGQQSPAQFITIENTGTAPLEVQNVTIVGSGAASFALSGTTSFTLAAQETRQLGISCSPTGGQQNANISVHSNDPSAALLQTALSCRGVPNSP